MCGMHRTTVSPSSSSTRRSTPCVAGCCGPRLMSICSPSRAGSSDVGASIATADPPPSTINGTRCGRPSASRPVVDSSPSIVRRVVAMPSLFSRRLARAQPPSHVVRQILEGLGDRELLLRVARLRICRERLTQLLRATEPPTKRKILSQRISFLVLLPHQQPPQIRMPGEANAEHVEAFPLEPIRAPIHAPNARDLERSALGETHLQPQKATIRQRPQVPHDLDRLLWIAKLDRRDIREIVVALTGIVMQPPYDVEQLRRADNDRRLAPHNVATLDRAG